jgi:hypothetical protein
MNPPTLERELVEELERLKRDPRFLSEPWEQGYRIALMSALDAVRRVIRRRARRNQKRGKERLK